MNMVITIALLLSLVTPLVCLSVCILSELVVRYRLNKLRKGKGALTCLESPLNYQDPLIVLCPQTLGCYERTTQGHLVDWSMFGAEAMAAYARRQNTQKEKKDERRP